MNKKGQGTMELMGTIIVVAIGVIVALVILTGALSPLIGQSTLTQTLTNDTITAAAVNSSINLEGQAVVGSIIIANSSGTVIVGTNFTVANKQVVDGVLTSTLTTNDAGSAYAGEALNVSYTLEPEGYISSSGGRAMANLIMIFAAMAIAIFALSPTLRNNLIDLVKK